jgi:predicted AAA+ superfamily ATPase
MLKRNRYLEQIRSGFRRGGIVALLGPRQCGKTTLARQFVESEGGGDCAWFDLESPRDQARLQNPELTLSRCEGWVVLDEVQQMPALFPVLRVLADRVPRPARFLILGSAAPELVRGASESLAGRLAFVDLSGFDIGEVPRAEQDRLWHRGGFPRSFLAGSDGESFAWREDFIRTYLTRDIPALGLNIPAANLRRFWAMLAHYHGQTWNGSEVGRSLGINYKTVGRYLDILTGAYLIRQLPPWFENIRKRQVKAPKIYFKDTGLLHALLNIRTEEERLTHPKLGASWEGFVVEQLAMRCGGEAYFWATHSGAEVDLLIRGARGNLGVEVKRNESPSVTPSMKSAVETLSLKELWVVYPGEAVFALTERITVMPLAEAVKRLAER